MGGRGRRRQSPASPAPAAGRGRQGAARSSCRDAGEGGRRRLDRERRGDGDRNRTRKQVGGREAGLSASLWASCGLGCVGFTLRNELCSIFFSFPHNKLQTYSINLLLA